jgi:diphosphomevalonate decarboxylase
MTTQTATARACSNIAFIKYWGNRDDGLRLPMNGSISMNLGALYTRTTVRFSADLGADSAVVDGLAMQGGGMARISKHLDHLRGLAGITTPAEVVSDNNFPAGAGIASSASAFAALTLAAAAALGLSLDQPQLSAIARLGSGSASRSVPGGFTEWQLGTDHASSYAETIAAPDHWPLIDLVAIVSKAHKATGSTEGHGLAPTSPLQAARVASTPARLAQCRAAILSRDIAGLAEVAEHDSNMMHSVMMTSVPPLFYWQPPTLSLMALVHDLRGRGLPVFYTIDAGANVHCLAEAEAAPAVRTALLATEGVIEVIESGAGAAAYVES